jgi:hypothetical protein
MGPAVAYSALGAGVPFGVTPGAVEHRRDRQGALGSCAGHVREPQDLLPYPHRKLFSRIVSPI